MGTDESASVLYGAGARALQDQFDSRRLADTLADLTVHDEFTAEDIDLVRSQSTVWVSTVDSEGWPDVSYKGGDVGFVEVINPNELRLPAYDGNGMWRTLGNIEDNGRVALLFVDTGIPWRMRVHGRARVSTSPADVEHVVGAKAIVIIEIVRVFPNCGRYIHQDDISEFVPREGAEPLLPDWKRLEVIRPVLPASDQAQLARESKE